MVALPSSCTNAQDAEENVRTREVGLTKKWHLETFIGKYLKFWALVMAQ